MKKSLLLVAALAATMTAGAQAPEAILEDVTPPGYDFSKYEDGAQFKVHASTGGNFWSPQAGIFDLNAYKQDGQFSVFMHATGDGTYNTVDAIAQDNAGICVRDFGGYLGKCLVYNQPWSPLATVTQGFEDKFGETAWPAVRNTGSQMLSFYFSKDDFQHPWPGRAVRVRLVFNVMRRGCHAISGDKGMAYARCFSEVLAEDNNGEAGFWYRPGDEWQNNAVTPESTVPVLGSEFAKWENEGTTVAEIPAEPKILKPTEKASDPWDNKEHKCADVPLYYMQLDRFMVYEWDVYTGSDLEHLKVCLNFPAGNTSVIIKEIKLFNITNARDLLELNDDGDVLGYKETSYINKRVKSWRYYTEKGVKEFQGGTEEPGEEVDLTNGEYFIRNTATGYYLSQGHSWGTMAVLKEPAARTYTFEAADGGYKIKSVMGYVKGGGELFVDGGSANDGGVFTIEKAGDHYYIKQGNTYVSANLEGCNYQNPGLWNYDFWLMENTNYFIDTKAETPVDGSLWDIVSREDMLATFADATPENPVDASFFVKAQNVEQNDPEVKTAWIYTKNGQKADLILEGRDWSGKVDWHAHAPYIWCINEEGAVAGTDVLSQDIEGLPAGKYEATYRLVNQSNTPLVVKFNNTEAKGFEKEGTDLWYTDAMEYLHKNECKATFIVGEDGKLAVRMEKTIDPAQQNRFAFKSLALKYMGEVAEEVQDGKTAETAWQVSTPDDVEAMKDKVSADAPTYFKLMNDIDMTGVNHIPAVGSGNADFGKTIHFDGNNHVISNLKSVAEGEEFYYASLFGVFQGSVKNLGLVDVELKSGLGAAGIGAYAGYGTVDATIDNCYVTGKIQNTGGYAGGIMGTTSATATITNCYAQVNVSGDKFVGGLVGRGRSTITLKNCYVSGTVSATGDNPANLVATTDRASGVSLVMENVVAVNTGATDMTNYGTMATGTVSTNIADVATWEAYNEGKTFNGLPALNWQENAEAGSIDEVAADTNAPAEYYNLQGIRVENPSNGFFIKKQGNKVTKVIVK